MNYFDLDFACALTDLLYLTTLTTMCKHSKKKFCYTINNKNLFSSNAAISR